MASIILKKRKLCEAIEEGLQITPASFEVKKRIDEQGEYKQLHESILPHLKVLFPDQQDDSLLDVLRSHGNDIISTIEYFKYRKPRTPEKSTEQNSASMDKEIIRILDKLSYCQSKDNAYELLSQFKQDILTQDNREKHKLVAEKIILRKAFTIQKNILLAELSKKQKTDESLQRAVSELESIKSQNNQLLIKLDQMEKNRRPEFRNDHIY